MENNKFRSKGMSLGRAAGLAHAAFYLLIMVAAVFQCGVSYGDVASYGEVSSGGISSGNVPFGKVSTEEAPPVTEMPPFNASLLVREEYDDNIFLTPNDRVYDYVTRVIPAIGVVYKTTWLDLKLDDKFYFWHYARQDASFYSNDANLASKLTVIRHFLYVDLTDTYSSVVLEPRGPSTDANRNVNRTDANVGNVIPYVKYDMTAASSVIAGGGYTNIWYRSNGINRDQYRGFLEIEQKFSPTFSALLGGAFLADRPQGNVEPSNNQTAAFAGMSSIITPRLRFGALGGYRWVHFSNGQDTNRPIYKAGLVYDFPAQGKAELRASSEFATTPLFGVVRNETQEALFQYFLMPTVFSIRGGVYHRDDKYAELIRTDEALGATAGLDYTPLPRLKFVLAGTYEKDRYSPQGTRREAYSGSTELDYKITPKATFGLTYSYNHSRGGLVTDRYFDSLAGIQVKAEL